MRRASLAFVSLVLAWLCAQQPQGLVVSVLVWLRQSAQFSHQTELARSLRVTLAQAEAAPDRDVWVADSAPEAPAPAPLPSVPLEKMPIALAAALNVVPPAAQHSETRDGAQMAGRRGRDVPVPVPRWPFLFRS